MIQSELTANRSPLRSESIGSSFLPAFGFVASPKGDRISRLQGHEPVLHESRLRYCIECLTA